MRLFPDRFTKSDRQIISEEHITSLTIFFLSFFFNCSKAFIDIACTLSHGLNINLGRIVLGVLYSVLFDMQTFLFNIDLGRIALFQLTSLPLMKFTTIPYILIYLRHRGIPHCFNPIICFSPLHLALALLFQIYSIFFSHYAWFALAVLFLCRAPFIH